MISIMRTGAYFEDVNGKKREVKNLGWLLRHWKNVTHFSTRGNGSPIGCDLIAYLENGGKYVVTWAQRSIMDSWLKRPVFIGLCIDGEPITKRTGKKHYLA